MNFNDDVTLRLVREESERAPAQSEIIYGGRPTGTITEGKILEKAVALTLGYLLFITDDIPEEEFLTVLLCDKDFKLLDKAVIGSPMSTGNFREAEISDAEVRFRFSGETLWHLKPLPHATFRLPFVSDPRGVTRPLGMRRHFTLEAKPQPQR